MAFPKKLIWLQERTPLSILSQPIIAEIAENLEQKTYSANQTIIVQDRPAPGLYIIETGRLETSQISDVNSDTPIVKKIACLLPGEIILLPELLLDQLTQKTISTITESQLFFLPAEKFKQLLEKYPEISLEFSRKLAQELKQISSQLSYEQQRQIELRPYLVTKVRRGIIGKSRYAVRLRQEIKDATEEGKSVLIFGEPGLEKDNIASLIHFSSPYRRQPIIKVNCNLLQTSGIELFGSSGGKAGLIEWLGAGTLILNNIQELPPELIPAIANLVKTNTYTPINRTDKSQDITPRVCRTKILMISEKILPEVDKFVSHVIKVPPLRVRKTDINEQVEYYLRLLCRTKGLSKPKITPEALRRLQSYDFPGNIRELENLVERALIQSNCEGELTEEVFWSVETKKKRFRLNLLDANPKLRKFLRSPWWPDRINYGFTLTFFALVIFVLCLGPQNRGDNFALNFFWAWWWPIVLLLFPFVGRLWCAVCPFMIYGEVTQKLSLWLWPRQLKSWPRQEAERWGGWFLFGLFALIFLWEELWDLKNTAYLSACLLLLITAGAMIFSAIFERRFWCRYLCPIGGMNGLFAKLSMTELRAQQGTCSAECSTYQCYKGGLGKGEGLETNGCPLYSHPAQLEDNRDCVLCMTCLKACPHRSVEVNLRPPGIELWTTNVARSYEVALLLLLFGGVFVHGLPELNSWLGLNLDLTDFWQHLGLAMGALIAPGIIILLAYGGSWLFYKLRCFFQGSDSDSVLLSPIPFVKLTYGYLPLVLGGFIAHYLRLGLSEAGRILPVSFATFGLNGEGLPVLVAHPAVIEFLQGTTLIFSLILTIVLTQKIARRSIASLWLQHLVTLIFMVGLWELMVGK
ncbi:MAG: sigma 54-interacting transcriptional regulator [Microcoleaceae cyanobacterium]